MSNFLFSSTSALVTAQDLENSFNNLANASPIFNILLKAQIKLSLIIMLQYTILIMIL